EKMNDAKFEHESVLQEMKEMPAPKLKAMGGAVDCPHCGRAMSEGGVAEREGDEIVAGFEDNKFDVLPSYGEEMSKADYTGKNSGDELGGPSKEDNDLVSRVM